MATILIVDERILDRGRLGALLTQRGHRVLEASSGDQALRVVRAERPELVLADALMSDMDGGKLVAHMYADPELSRPRVMFRAAPWMEAEARALASVCGVSHVVPDTGDPVQLLEEIDAALSSAPSASGNLQSAADGIAAALRPIVRKLFHRLAELEIRVNGLQLQATECGARLEVARSALEQEVQKRIWAEQELTEANLRLHDLAVRDALTGLYNRYYLEESLAREASRAARNGLAVGVMMIDIDHFKRCNDTFGHAAGDAVLRAVGRDLLSLARSGDVICRYGGEEFVLVMPQAATEVVLARGEEIRRSVLALELNHEGRPIGPVTLSIGVAMLPDHGSTGEAVLQAADAALYLAKAAGRDRVVLANWS